MNDLTLLLHADQAAGVLLGGHLRAALAAGDLSAPVRRVCEAAMTDSRLRALLLLRARMLVGGLAPEEGPLVLRELLDHPTIRGNGAGS